jgi:hypothetical protein
MSEGSASGGDLDVDNIMDDIEADADAEGEGEADSMAKRHKTARETILEPKEERESLGASVKEEARGA